MAGAPGIGAGRQRCPRAAAPLPGTYATRRRRAPAAADAPAGTRRGRERAAERQAADRERLQQYNRAKADYANRDNACATCQACQEDVPCSLESTQRCVMYINKYILKGSGLD